MVVETQWLEDFEGFLEKIQSNKQHNHKGHKLKHTLTSR